MKKYIALYEGIELEELPAGVKHIGTDLFTTEGEMPKQFREASDEEIEIIKSVEENAEDELAFRLSEKAEAKAKKASFKEGRAKARKKLNSVKAKQ